MDELPSDLDETYERILKNFSSKPVMITRARHLFECAAFASRHPAPGPCLAAFAEILTIDFDSALPWRCLTSAVHSEDSETTIIRTCPRLLEIVSGDEGHKTVQFIHRSAQEYLTSATLRQSASSPAYSYSFDESSANLTLAKICLSVLVEDGPVSDLQTYADEFWWSHVSSRDEDALGELLDSFLQMDSPSFARWEGRTHDKVNTAFHWAARLGMYRRVERMLGCLRHNASTPADNFVQIRDGEGDTALNLAAAWGHVDVCRLLIEHGALVEAPDSTGNTPLHIAANYAYLDLVRLLLEYPAADGFNAAPLRCSIRNNQGQIALHRAAYWGHAEVCQLLLDHGALVDEADNDGQTPLQLAKEERKSDVVDILSKHVVATVSDT